MALESTVAPHKPASVSSERLAKAANLRLRRLDEDSAVWQRLLSEVGSAGLYHRDSWVKVLAHSYGFQFWLATLSERDEIIAGCIFAQPRFSRRLISLPFSDACPPLSREPQGAADLLDTLAAAAPPGRIYEVRDVRGPSSWATVECFVKWQLPLDRPLRQIERSLSVNFRRNLRRAAREAIIIEHGSSLDFLQRFYTLQLLSRRRLGLPPQPWKFFKLVREGFAPTDNFEVWMAKENGKDVASAVFLHDRFVVHYKWGARRSNSPSSANHLLFWNAIEEFASRALIFDLGRTDVRNQGLMRFKRELGASPRPLPSSFYPQAPKHVSSEILTGNWAFMAKSWRHLPIFATALAGRLIYRFLA
jgi:hypothetical protein